MQIFLIYIFKGLKLLLSSTSKPIDYSVGFIIYYLNGVEVKSFRNSGIPLVNVGIGGKCKIGENFKTNNREMSNPIGRFNSCSIIVGKNGLLIIGDNVGISSSAIVCQNSIEIGNYVKIGGNVVIYDTDFHSLKSNDRLNRLLDVENTISKPVKIGNNVFIGAHSTILKGVSIGDNAIIGSCSVVTKSIPTNEIWAGNPAEYIRKI